jgi:hypothetical protein
MPGQRMYPYRGDSSGPYTGQGYGGPMPYGTSAGPPMVSGPHSGYGGGKCMPHGMGGCGPGMGGGRPMGRPR